MVVGHWQKAFQGKTLYDPLLCSPIVCARWKICVVLGDVVVRLRQETKDYQGLKYAKCRWLRIALVTKGPEEPFRTRSFGVSCLTGQHLACLFTEWTPASPAKSIVSQTKPRSRQQTSFDAKSHEAWIWGFTMDLPCFTRVREICHVCNSWKRRHSGTWHWELRAEQRDSKIEEGSSSHFRILTIEHLQQRFVWFSLPMSWKPKFALLARSVCILGVVIAMIWHSTRDRILFP